MGKQVRVTSAEVMAAQTLVKFALERGEIPSPKVLKLANARSSSERFDRPPLHSNETLTSDERKAARDSLNELDLESLAVRASDGNETAKKLLVERIYPTIHRYSRSRLLSARWRASDAEDVAQDALVNIIDRLPHYRSGRPFLAFAYSIASSTIAKAIETRTKTKSLPYATVPDQRTRQLRV